MAKNSKQNKEQVDYLSAIQKLLNSSYLDDDQQKLSEYVKEYNQTMSREIKSRKEISYLLYKFDKTINIGESQQVVFPYFTQTDGFGLKQICDYAIFLQFESQLFILLVELKYGMDSASNQLNASKRFIEYILDTIKISQDKIDKKSEDKIRLPSLDKIKIALLRISEKNTVRSSASKAIGFEFQSNKIIIESTNSKHFILQDAINFINQNKPISL